MRSLFGAPLSRRWRSTLPLLAFVALAAAAGVAATELSVQIVVFGAVLVLAFIVQSKARIILLASIFIPLSGLLRRLLSGAAGYTDTDPLVLLPLVLVCLALAGTIGTPKSNSHLGWPRAFAVMAAVGSLGTLALRGALDVSSVFFAMCIAVPMMLVFALSSGRLANVWPQEERLVAILAGVAGVYGVIQFFLLPAWDRSWMISTGLTSVGAPFPLQVRVFGASESPGPYALYIGLAIVLLLTIAVTSRRRSAPALLLASLLAFPLILSGVRTSLLAIVVCLTFVAILRGRGWGRLVPVLLLFGLYFVLNNVLSLFSGQSSILTADRYTSFDSNTDGSVLARLGLLEYLSNPFAHLVGNPRSPSLDNLFIDVLVRYGLVAAVGVAALFVSVFVVSIRNLSSARNEVASACALFICVSSMSGNVFNTQFGILIGIVFGTVLSAESCLASRGGPVATVGTVSPTKPIRL